MRVYGALSWALLPSQGLRGSGGRPWGIPDGPSAQGQRGHAAGASYGASSVGLSHSRFVVSACGWEKPSLEEVAFLGDTRATAYGQAG